MTPISLILIALLLVSCTKSQPDAQVAAPLDSCAIALKFENALVTESGVAPGYTGELKNYWGDDTTKLDFKHTFTNGRLVRSLFYYENGNVEEAYAFECSAQHGTQKWYHENGQLAQTIHYSYGYRQGTAQRFDEQGKLIEEAIFEADTLKSAVKK